MSRRLLHHTKLEAFKTWLESKGIEFRDGQGQYQVLQVKQNNLWLAIYERFEIKSDYSVKQKPHLTNDKRLDQLVGRFCRDIKEPRMNMREQFEAWAEKELLPLDRRDTNHYRYNLTNRAWEGWQAALAAQVQQEPVSNLNHSDIALLKQWFNAVQDLNPKYLNEGDFQLLAKLQSQAQQTESQWQPMETAPKNKKIIVRYKNVLGNDRTVFAKYLDKFTEEASEGTDCETDYCEDDDTFYCKEGWIELIDNWDDFSSVYFDSRNVPTHWMPLPPAPEGE